MMTAAPAPLPDIVPPPPVLDPEALFRSDNPWDWWLAGLLVQADDEDGTELDGLTNARAALD